jgi:ketosteroid isomerase-like protein
VRGRPGGRCRRARTGATPTGHRAAKIWVVSQSNVELVRAAFEAFYRGDEAAMLALTAPDVVVTQFPDQLDVRDYHGHEGIQQVMRDWIGTWDDWSIEILGAREVDGLVFVTALQRGRGRTSGAPIEGEVIFVFTVHRGAIARWQMFRSEQEARDAVDLGGPSPRE